MALMVDPTAPRKKYALVKVIRAWNLDHPKKRVEYAPGFDPDTFVIGDPARDTLRKMQTAVGRQAVGHFDHATMLWLLPPGIRGRVMARVHSELGVHEWPPGSNRGPVEKYLKAVGLSGGYPWCAAFVTWVLKKEDRTHFPPNPASSDSWGKWAKQHSLTKPNNQTKHGDLWVWEWGNSDGMLDHIGFADEGIKGAMAYYVDGNVGAGGGTVTDSSRKAGNIAVTIDLEKLWRMT